MGNILQVILPSTITATVSIVAIIVSYISSNNSLKNSYENNINNMRFSQKEKVVDQISEKVAALLTKCNPNTLNTLINDIVPREISHEDNRVIRTRLLGISDEIQTLSNTIKMLTYSIFDDKDMLSKFEDLSNKLDDVESRCSKMLFKLSNIYASMTPEGRIRNMNIMEELRTLERNFSEEYRTPFIELNVALFDMIWYIRRQSIPTEKSSKKNKTSSKHNK